MRTAIPILTSLGCLLFLLGLLLNGCGAHPSGSDPALDAECAQCHVDAGDGIPVPSSHWDGDLIDAQHDGCTLCHSPHG